MIKHVVLPHDPSEWDAILTAEKDTVIDGVQVYWWRLVSVTVNGNFNYVAWFEQE